MDALAERSRFDNDDVHRTIERRRELRDSIKDRQASRSESDNCNLEGFHGGHVQLLSRRCRMLSVASSGYR